ncbi:MAG: hypothetical protein WCF85_08605 [Rhodospirillaceae bacterium]
MASPVRRPPRHASRPLINRISAVRAGERLAGEIVEEILRRAETSKLDPDRLMLDVLVGLVLELADAPRHEPAELADLVQDAAEMARAAV